jgi:hypothetical protein
LSPVRVPGDGDVAALAALGARLAGGAEEGFERHGCAPDRRAGFPEPAAPTHSWSARPKRLALLAAGDKNV